jgi:signal transduction histidine kinase
VNLSHFIRRMLVRAEPMLSRRSVRAAFRVEDSEAEVIIDPIMFNQAFTSIITNAAEAMPEGGTLTVTLRQSDEAGHVELLIADTGTGIAPDVLARIPSPFVTTKTRGLGLGLTLAMRMVERFSGRLTLESAVGKGTTVTIRLPRQS